MPWIDGKYYTDSELREITRRVRENDNSDLISSAVIGYVTGSSLLGGILGGSFTGGVIGDLLEGDEDSFF